MPPSVSPANGHRYSDVLTLVLGSNRKRKLTYIFVATCVLVLFLFAREAYSYADSLAIPHTRIYTPQEVVSDTRLPEMPSAMPPPPIQPVVFSFIMWSEDSAAEGAQLIKTILMYSSGPVDIHVICDDVAESLLRGRLSLVQRPSHHIRVWFRKPSWQAMLDRIEREGAIKTDHSAGLPGLMKLFIHEILPSNVTKSIFVDTDALFISDPTLIWDIFSTLKPSTAIVMGSHPDQQAPEWHYASKICSCVMLLNLEKLRSIRLMDSSIYREMGGVKALSPEAFVAKYGLPGGDGTGRYDNVRLGDQGYWWAIVDYHPDLFEPLSYDFEVTSCLLQTYHAGLGDELISMEEEQKHQIFVKDTPQEGITVLPKLLHFNCLHGTPRYMNWKGWSDPADELTVRWGPALSYHVGYKWIWLNKGRPNNPDQILEMFTVSNVVFADQLAERSNQL
ncbi:glycosyltransferase family 8 protein [Hypholoma sublateritium FD-334 SS-4]|uniref:Glycosyltransferase family 8 protein n=1 Tax=Hypholoma sublateritium (strain FD-334 SS-4) TaxID=945553 RepID=A0A0D2MTA8_HYPSF|nr:glycosyltransferase family 8 protein [Hypholoma sublateritium FD-334 SS-4]